MLIYHKFQKKMVHALGCLESAWFEFGKLEEVPPSFQLTLLTPNIELKIVYMKSFWHFDTLGSQNPKPFGGTHFIA
jgi:hypothetical protein